MNEEFLAQKPTLDDYWRAIILFGRNVASYKFALAASLLELNPRSGQLVTLDELAIPFSRHIAEHLKLADKQATSRSSRFLDCCRRHNSGELSSEKLVEETVRLGFNNVIDAFHIVGSKETPERFFLDERGPAKGIRITDEFSRLTQSVQAKSLPAEVESRWRLVETAWEYGMSSSLLRIDFDEQTGEFLALDKQQRRTAVTSSRDALNGYQKGRCFYCFREISLTNEALKPDVDHFFPHILKQYGWGPLIDGIWNLVLSCRDCNRGQDGKFASVPTTKLLARLSNRNEFLITSHHPLRETLMAQTGATPAERRAFLQDWHDRARASLIHQWEADEVAEAVF